MVERKKKPATVKLPRATAPATGFPVKAPEGALTQRQVVTELTRSPHGKLEEYLPIGIKAAQEDPNFFGHLVAWDALKGQVRDAHAALPVIAFLNTPGATQPVLMENALAHLATLNPRDLDRALVFARPLVRSSGRKTLDRLVERYLRELEGNEKTWDRRAVQHKAKLHGLYARHHIKPSARAKAVLFEGERPKGSVFEIIRNLPSMEPVAAAGAILKYRVPFLIAEGALGAKAKDPALVQALIQQMTPTELVTNTKRLERLGVQTVPALRAAYDEALGKAAGAKKGKATLKTTRAAEAVEEENPVLAAKLNQLQEAQIAAMGGIDGNWAVLGDRSGSMASAIAASMEVVATLTKAVKGDVHWLLFNTTPTYVRATGLTYEVLKAHAAKVTATGGTSIGVGLNYLIENNIQVDGIAIVSDAAENTVPYFAGRYQAYVAKFGSEPPVYLYRMGGSLSGFSDQDLATTMKAAGLELIEFALGNTTDFYSLPNVVRTMRASRYSLLDEIMAAPLLALDEVLPKTKGQEVYRAPRIENVGSTHA